MLMIHIPLLFHGLYPPTHVFLRLKSADKFNLLILTMTLSRERIPTGRDPLRSLSPFTGKEPLHNRTLTVDADASLVGLHRYPATPVILSVLVPKAPKP